MDLKLDMDNPASGIQLGPESLKDPVVQELLLDKVPVNRKNYMEYAGLQEPLDPEVEAELPLELQKPQP
jgi:hypothetical protein